MISRAAVVPDAGHLGPWYTVDGRDEAAVAEHARLRALAPAIQAFDEFIPPYNFRMTRSSQRR